MSDLAIYRRIDRRVDLKSLHPTAYGHEILTTLGIGLSCDSYNLYKVTNAFEELGFSISVYDDKTHSQKTNMSTDMQEYILHLVAYKFGN